MERNGRYGKDDTLAGCRRGSPLEAAGMFDTLLFLRDSGECRKIDLYRGIGRGSEMAPKLDLLEDVGLIDQRMYGRVTLLSLTEDGRRVADMVAGIQGILDGITPRIPKRDAIESRMPVWHGCANFTQVGRRHPICGTVGGMERPAVAPA